jgi:hypothetical protein
MRHSDFTRRSDQKSPSFLRSLQESGKFLNLSGGILPIIRSATDDRARKSTIHDSTIVTFATGC